MLPFMYSGMFRLVSTVTFPSYDKDARHNNKGGKRKYARHKTECVTLISSFHPNIGSTTFPLTSTDLITQIEGRKLYCTCLFHSSYNFFLPPAMFCLMEANLKQLPHENGRCRYKYIYIFFIIY